MSTPAAAAGTPLLGCGIPLRHLVALLLGWIGVDQLLLWRFLGIAHPAFLAVGVLALAAMVGMIVRGGAAPGPSARIGLGTIAACIAAAALLLALGGEGRFFYANIDWQVRDAVLRDMGRHAWPFVYPFAGADQLLRAPIGMYLAPAIAAKLFGVAGGDLGLLVQNALLLGLCFAMAATLFDTRRARLTALAVFVAFSGLDIVGTWLMHASGAPAALDHIENWSGLQYSSTVTLAFWVPQHALAGWLCAILYLLWRAGRLPIAPLLAAVPLLALWSPLAIMGALPFAALAGARTLLSRHLLPTDIAAPAIAVGLATPALLYLRAGSAAVGGGSMEVLPLAWMMVILLEVAPFAVPALRHGLGNRFGGATLLVAVGCLLAMPFHQIGSGTDFQTRASIVPLAILAMAVADMIAGSSGVAPRAPRRFLITMLAVGAATGVMEIRRALVTRPSPVTRCSLVGAWDQQSGTVAAKSTYLAPRTALPAFLRGPVAARVDIAADPPRCWLGPWRSSPELGWP